MIDFKFLFTSFKTEKHMKARAEECWVFTATYMGIKKPGKHPPVITKKQAVRTGIEGRWLNGHYKSISFIKWVLKERVWVLENDNGGVLCHEFAHCLMTRRGDKIEEIYPEKVRHAWDASLTGPVG